MKLKTLKDLVKFANVKGFKIGESGTMDLNMPEMVDLEVIKAEAIKWVKSRKGHKNTPSHTETWLMIDFFNITSEDLK